MSTPLLDAGPLFQSTPGDFQFHHVAPSPHNPDAGYRINKKHERLLEESSSPDEFKSPPDYPHSSQKLVSSSARRLFPTEMKKMSLSPKPNLSKVRLNDSPMHDDFDISITEKRNLYKSPHRNADMLDGFEPLSMQRAFTFNDPAF